MKRKITFEQWMKEVDRFLSDDPNTGGMTSSDLPDCAYADWYERGMSSKSAAKKAIKSAMEF